MICGLSCNHAINTLMSVCKCTSSLINTMRLLQMWPRVHGHAIMFLTCHCECQSKSANAWLTSRVRMAGSSLIRMEPKAIMAALCWCQFSYLIFALMKGIMAEMIGCAQPRQERQGM